MHLRWRGIPVFPFTFLWASLAWASITGSISGLVTDATGAVISGAQVISIETQTGIQTKTTTDSKGFYELLTLAIGTGAAHSANGK
jgi:Carboxypeptidase regulatory-like domain